MRLEDLLARPLEDLEPGFGRVFGADPDALANEDLECLVDGIAERELAGRDLAREALHVSEGVPARACLVRGHR